MRNIVIIIVILSSLAYMFVLMTDKYDSIKETNAKIQKHK